MTRLLIAAFALLAAAPAAAAERVYPVTDFDRVHVEGPYEVTLEVGGPSSARVDGSREAIEAVSVEVQGRTLRIRPNRSAWGGYPGASTGPVTIRLATRSLRGASVTGAGSLTVDGARGLRLDLAVSGSGRVAANGVQADMLVLGLAGSGELAVAGTAKSVKATVAGAGDLDAAGLRAEDAEINAETSGNVAMEVRRNAKIVASGPGSVAIIGDPACTVSVRGSAQVDCGD